MLNPAGFRRSVSSEVTRAKLREWASGLDVTPKRLANILLPLRAVLKDAAADEIIDRNVLHGWKPEIKAKLRDETARTIRSRRMRSS